MHFKVAAEAVLQQRKSPNILDGFGKMQGDLRRDRRISSEEEVDHNRLVQRMCK